MDINNVIKESQLGQCVDENEQLKAKNQELIVALNNAHTIIRHRFNTVGIDQNEMAVLTIIEDALGLSD